MKNWWTFIISAVFVFGIILADIGKSAAQNILGNLNVEGSLTDETEQGLISNFDRMRYYLEQAMPQNYGRAIYHFVAVFFNGPGYENTQKALSLYSETNYEGHSKLKFELGVFYIRGDGVPQNYRKAMEQFTFAAQVGVQEAQYNLGYLYYRGFGDNKDKKIVVRWLTSAAEQGDPKAQFLLGEIYYSGNGVEKNETTGIAWLKRAAAQGFVPAIENLQYLEH